MENLKQTTNVAVEETKDDAYWEYLMHQATKKKNTKYEEHWQYLLNCCTQKGGDKK